MVLPQRSRVTLAVFGLARAAWAAPEPTWDAPPPRAVPAHIPPAARGFQAALRTGVALPWGRASEDAGDELSARTGLQLPVVIDAGFKLNKPLFLGVYGGVGFGSGAVRTCSAENFDCSAVSYQLGVQAQYHFGASEPINPWLGYGLGYEILTQSLGTADYSESQTSSGVTFAKLGLGVDFRGFVGLGPFLEVSAGRFTRASTSVDDAEVHDGPVDDAAWHGFFSAGVRLVVLP